MGDLGQRLDDMKEDFVLFYHDNGDPPNFLLTTEDPTTGNDFTYERAQELGNRIDSWMERNCGIRWPKIQEEDAYHEDWAEFHIDPDRSAAPIESRYYMWKAWAMKLLAYYSLAHGLISPMTNSNTPRFNGIMQEMSIRMEELRGLVRRLHMEMVQLKPRIDAIKASRDVRALAATSTAGAAGVLGRPLLPEDIAALIDESLSGSTRARTVASDQRRRAAAAAGGGAAAAGGGGKRHQANTASVSKF